MEGRVLQEKLLGYTGHIEFDSYGFRTEFTMDIIQLGPNNLTKVGTWNKKTGTNYTRTQNETIKDVIQGLHNKTLIVSFAFQEQDDEQVERHAEGTYRGGVWESVCYE
ncbi:Glutamate receptor ionotropic, kainate 2 [Portunus trituberculatus]|uniref:Glutamate receptor ionotropic, kainate 2 n=1 Tax=Portunus trituberculatus TaxID=210409 RepID=A0A5B7FIY6_PORTR|nr:Glutamate receptor ionotropic, kainate 2 [Portunus trituberculatus]